MTTQALERAARAAFETFMPTNDAAADLCGTWEEFNEDGGNDNLWFELARAVLMAVLPTLERLDECDSPGMVSSTDGDYVLYADLEAILGEGEGE